MAFPARVNPDSSHVCASGRLLLTTCAVMGCVILNGRWGGLGDGTLANVPGYTYSRSGSGVGGSVIDYCLVSQGFWSNITRFAVGAFEAE
jgi:hypothetical protein